MKGKNMTIYSKKNRVFLGFLGMALSFDFAIADGKQTSEFENRYQPSPREVCEMYASANILADYPECKSIKLFEPTIEMDLTDAENSIVKVNKEKFPDWPFPEAYFEKINERDERELIFNIAEELGSFELGDIIHNSLDIKTIAIGKIDNVIVLEVRGKIHSQMIFTPYSCKGHEGYGDETYYDLSQAFQWLPTFANESYEKRFYSLPLCN